MTYLEEPALGSILYAREVPAFGGDTLFANMYSAYDALSEGMKRILAGMTAVHRARRAYSPRSSYSPKGQRSMKILRSNAAEAEFNIPWSELIPRPAARRCLLTGHSPYVSST